MIVILLVQKVEMNFVYFTLAVYIKILVKFILNLGQHRDI
jgi:hypothetical protein